VTDEPPRDDRGSPVDPDPKSNAPIGILAGERPNRRRRRHRRRRTGRLLLVLGVLALPFLAGAAWFWYQVDSPGGPGRAVSLTIPSGDGVSAIADRLEQRGVIGSSLAFQIYTRLGGHDRFQAGAYRLHEDMGVGDAVTTLERGPRQRYRTLTLAPGLTFAQIADRIGALPGLDASKALDAATTGAVRSRYEPPSVSSLEGLTWPDSYAVSEHETEVAVVRRIVRAFDAHATRAGLATASDPYHTLIVASLIEREAGVDEDRPKIAAVIENRLRDGMPLQVDATVVYARGGGKAPLTDADFQRDSPYNTYRVTGLPPTPIATFTGPSLQAALHPADVAYLYYVLTDTNGRHAFAVTYAQHEANVADARRRGVIK